MPINFPNAPTLNETYFYGGRVWKWNGVAWESVSSSFGPTGPQGLSAYEVAVDNGFGGTEAEWVAASINTIEGNDIRVTVAETAPTGPETNDLWFW
jgi:hypothetical protein